ncbi:MAG: ABC transporter substrate-binding protein [Christensenellaceae bacterium]
MGDDGSLETLINSYFDGTATFTYENKSSSPQTGDLVVATNAYFPPFEYFEGNKFKGVDIEIASKIATKLGKTLFVKDMDFEAIIPSVASGESDIGMAGLTVNDERLKTVDFSLGYYSSYQVITVRESTTLFDECKNAEDVENILKAQNSKYKIGTQNGTTGYMYSAGDSGFGYDGFKNLTTKGYTTGALAMKDLSNGKIDAVILDKQPSLMIAATLNK